MSEAAESLDAIRRSIDTVPWDHLVHAYAPAIDAPAQLAVFLDPTSTDNDTELAADWLWGAVLHQGSIYSASIPVVWILIDVLALQPDHRAAPAVLQAIETLAIGAHHAGDDEPATEPARRSEQGEPLYETWLQQPAPASFDEDDMAHYTAGARVRGTAMRSVVRHATGVIRAALADDRAETRTAAVAAGLAAWRVLPEGLEQLDGLVQVIADPDYDAGAWVSVAMVLAELGRPVVGLLDHADRRVRLAGAMSVGTRDDPRSIPELAQALAEPEWLEQAFPHGAAHVDMHLRFHVLRALLDRTQADTVDEPTIDAICTLIDKRAGRYTVDAEWGPILRWAFADREVALPFGGDPLPLPHRLSITQRRIVEALCAKRELWDTKSGNAHAQFRRVQLPFARDEMRLLLDLRR